VGMESRTKALKDALQEEFCNKRQYEQSLVLGMMCLLVHSILFFVGAVYLLLLLLAGHSFSWSNAAAVGIMSCNVICVIWGLRTAIREESLIVESEARIAEFLARLKESV